ncbi:glycosyltransferase [Chloroflexota bacterium]
MNDCSDIIPQISIIIPTYCEAPNLTSLVDGISDSFAASLLKDNGVEIIVVDDNSPDDTKGVCQSLASRYSELKLITRVDERGLATAVKRGIKESNGDILVIMDADSSHNPALIPILIEQITNNGQDITIGSRFVNSSNMHSSLRCIWGSRILNRFISILLQIPVKDITGGFLAVKKSALNVLDHDYVFKGYGDYCFALLHEGMKQGWRFKEIGYHYQPRKHGKSKTNFYATGFRYGIRAIKIRFGWG